MKRIPYGISNFRQVRRDNMYYVDKTMYIERLEQAGNFLFLIRPRRFGKSLFLNMLCAYYDLARQDEFDTVFDGLYAKEHPTPEKGQYQVLRLDFSRIGGKDSELEDNFDSYCGIMLDSFASTYAQCYPEGFAERVRNIKKANQKLNFIDAEAKNTGARLYLVIDEYDNFTNTVLNEEGEAVYHALTHATGFYRNTFKQYKGMFDRILMLGVSPVTMDDLTSGYNIATNITMDPRFNMMLGFSETDVREMIRYYQGTGQISATEKEIIDEIKPWYDNYCFAKYSLDADPKMFNCDMVLYYMQHLVNLGQSPEQMIDPNTRTDYGKMKKLIRLDGTGSYRTGIINKIAEQGYILGNIEESFPAEQLTKPEKFVSLLFYYGMLTIEENLGNMLKLIIPNNNVRKQYYDYMLEEYQNIANVDTRQLNMDFHQTAVEGNWQPMMQHLAEYYRQNTAIRQLIEGERNVQGFFNAYLSLNPYYLTAPEVELNHGYCDFFLMPDLKRYPMIRHSYIVELKYLPTTASETEVTKQWEQAVRQILQYAEGRMVNKLAGETELHLIIMQIKGFSMIRMEEIPFTNTKEA